MKTAKKWIQEQYPEMIHDDEFMCKMMEAFATQQIEEATKDCYPKDFVEWYVTEGQFKYRFIGVKMNPLAEALDNWTKKHKEMKTIEEEFLEFQYGIKLTQEKALIHPQMLIKIMREFADQQVKEVTKQRDELLIDIDFLAHRQQKAGSVSFTEERETGISSNSIVAIVYGIVKPENQSLPCDWSDLNACRNMWKKLPEHRKTGDVLIAMQRAEAAIKSMIDEDYPAIDYANLNPKKNDR